MTTKKKHSGKEPAVTVLVAVWNAAPFLEECLHSLAVQTLREMQVVCIDDGSTDESPAILARHAARWSEAEWPRLEIITLQRNGGQAHARNVGLQRAQGRYICMLDADDSFSPDALQLAVDAMERHSDTDSVLFHVSMDYPDHSTPYPMPAFEAQADATGRLTGQAAFRLSLNWQVHGLYLVRAAIHQAHPYDESCLLYSDDNTTRLHYLSSRFVARCSGTYHYRQHAASATHAVSVRRYDYLTANASMRRQLQQAGADADLLALYENHRWLNLVGVALFHYLHSRQLPRSERRQGLALMRAAWQSVDRQSLQPALARKFGYRPMPAWWLFRLQEWLYFSLRALLGRNKEPF